MRQRRGPWPAEKPGSVDQTAEAAGYAFPGWKTVATSVHGDAESGRQQSGLVRRAGLSVRSLPKVSAAAAGCDTPRNASAIR
jgi:hypothetical protein